MLVFDPMKVREKLRAQGKSISALARYLELSPTGVRGWLNARHQPSLGSIEKLAIALGCEPEEVMVEVEDPVPGVQGAIGMRMDEAIVLAVLVQIVAGDAKDWADTILAGLNSTEREELLRRLVLKPKWAAAWQKLKMLSFEGLPMCDYAIEVKVIAPKGEKTIGKAIPAQQQQKYKQRAKGDLGEAVNEQV